MPTDSDSGRALRNINSGSRSVFLLVVGSAARQLVSRFWSNEMWLLLQKHAVCVLYLSEGAATAAATNNRHDHRHHHHHRDHRHRIAWRIKAATTAATRPGQTQRRLLSVTKTLPASRIPQPAARCKGALYPASSGFAAHLKCAQIVAHARS